MKTAIAIGTLAGIWGSAWLFMQRDLGPVIGAAGLAGIVAVLFCAVGLLKMRYWALAMSFMLAGAAFTAGCYGFYFLWTFWTTAPTLAERIRSVALSPVPPALIVPLAWVFYFGRRPVCTQFKGGPNA